MSLGRPRLRRKQESLWGGDDPGGKPDGGLSLQHRTEVPPKVDRAGFFREGLESRVPLPEGDPCLGVRSECFQEGGEIGLGELTGESTNPGCRDDNRLFLLLACHRQAMIAHSLL